MWTQTKFGENGDIYGMECRPDTIGSQPLLITMSGLGQAMSEKNFLFSRLRKRMDALGQWIIQFDYRGHGDSVGSFSSVTLQSMTRDAITVIESCIDSYRDGLESIWLIGTGLGGIIAQKTAIHAELALGLSCRGVIAISTPCTLPHSESVFDRETLKWLRKYKYIATDRLVPGSDYLTMHDFNMEQLDYLFLLGAQVHHFHGQFVSYQLISELDNLDPIALFGRNNIDVHFIYGEQDEDQITHARLLPRARTHLLPDVKYYYEHPEASDRLLAQIEQIILAESSVKGWDDG